MLAISLLVQSYRQLNLNFTHTCQYMHVSTCLLHIKFKNLACTCTVARNFGVCMFASEHMGHMTDGHHELALGLPHYTCGIQVQWIHIDNGVHHLAAGQLLILFCD